MLIAWAWDSAPYVAPYVAGDVDSISSSVANSYGGAGKFADTLMLASSRGAPFFLVPSSSIVQGATAMW